VATGRFERYAPRIARLPQRTLTAADLLIGAFLLEPDGDLSVHDIRFDRTNPFARVVLIGNTPVQPDAARLRGLRPTGLNQGLAYEDILDLVGQTASFAGQVRTNLTRMLDDLGLPGLLAIDRTEQLLSEVSIDA